MKKISEIHYKIKKLENKIVKDIINSSDIILSTNSTAAIEEIVRTKFNVVIVDEASYKNNSKHFNSIIQGQKIYSCR